MLGLWITYPQANSLKLMKIIFPGLVSVKPLTRQRAGGFGNFTDCKMTDCRRFTEYKAHSGLYFNKMRRGEALIWLELKFQASGPVSLCTG